MKKYTIGIELNTHELYIEADSMGDAMVKATEAVIKKAVEFQLISITDN